MTEPSRKVNLHAGIQRQLLSVRASDSSCRGASGPVHAENARGAEFRGVGGPDQTPRQKTNLGLITMKPREADGAALDQAAGSLDSFRIMKRRVWMVPRDGVEPPTPAFSGPDSPAAFLLKHLDLGAFPASKNTRILEPNGTTQFTMCDPGSAVSLSTTRPWDSGTNCW
jgi:hypothetical protein